MVSVLHAGGVLGWSAALEEDQGQGVFYTEMRENTFELKALVYKACVCSLGASGEAERGI